MSGDISCKYRRSHWCWYEPGNPTACVEPCPLHPATNAERIKAMTDEELAEQLVINVDGLSKKRVYLAAPVGEIFARRDIAEVHTLAWLQQPYKED